MRTTMQLRPRGDGSIRPAVRRRITRARTFPSVRRPRYLKENLRVLAFGLVKVPLIGYVAPRVVELSDDRVVFRIRLRRPHSQSHRQHVLRACSARERT